MPRSAWCSGARTPPPVPTAAATCTPTRAITGFSLTHLSGPGCKAEGDVPVLPTVGVVSATSADGFSHGTEAADAGYYKVALSNGVTTELTATTRTGMARLHLPREQPGQPDLQAGRQPGRRHRDQLHRRVSDTEVAGSVTSGGFCGSHNSYTLYFDMRFSQPFASSGTFFPGGGAGKHGPSSAYLTFLPASGKPLLAKVGVSYVSAASAAGNLAAENPGWDFDATRSATHAAWNRLLRRIRIGGGSAASQQVFYTALYHALLDPSVFSDDNRQYRGVDGRVHTVDPGHAAFYTNFSGWDIYRTQAQLEALLDPAAASDAAQSMVDD